MISNENIFATCPSHLMFTLIHFDPNMFFLPPLLLEALLLEAVGMFII